MGIRIGELPLLKQIQRRIRQKRVTLFLTKVQPSKDWKVLDIGGTMPTWRYKGMEQFSVTLLNLSAPKVPESEADRFITVAGDATALEYSDNFFDLVFSNSVIEHVGTFENQKKFATEALRVSKRIWIQTPAQEFFFEPHYITPFIHWFPDRIRQRLVRWFTVWGFFSRPSREQVKERIAEIRLLRKDEMCELFEGCEILEEKFLWMTKSYIAFRNVE